MSSPTQRARQNLAPAVEYERADAPLPDERPVVRGDQQHTRGYPGCKDSYRDGSGEPIVAVHQGDGKKGADFPGPNASSRSRAYASCAPRGITKSKVVNEE
jgi:hypothetical protein